jgi:hypothetical protein
MIVERLKHEPLVDAVWSNIVSCVYVLTPTSDHVRIRASARDGHGFSMVIN